MGAGLGGAWWRERRTALSALAPDAGPPEALWHTPLPQPDGGTLTLASLRGQPLLLNFWATWCPPCVKEMPDLDRFAQTHPHWRVVGLAIDQAEAVQRFLASQPVRFAVALAGAQGLAWAQALGNSQGGLPFTVALDASGRITHRHLGATDLALLQSWANG